MSCSGRHKRFCFALNKPANKKRFSNSTFLLLVAQRAIRIFQGVPAFQLWVLAMQVCWCCLLNRRCYCGQPAFFLKKNIWSCDTWVVGTSWYVLVYMCIFRGDILTSWIKVRNALNHTWNGNGCFWWSVLWPQTMEQVCMPSAIQLHTRYLVL